MRPEIQEVHVHVSNLRILEVQVRLRILPLFTKPSIFICLAMATNLQQTTRTVISDCHGH